MFRVNNKDHKMRLMTLLSLLVSLLLLNIFHTLFKVYIVDFEQVTAYWAFRTISVSPEFFQPQPQQQKIYIKICSSHFAPHVCLRF